MNPIISTISQRLALGVMTLFLVSIVIFVSVAMLPGGLRLGGAWTGSNA